MKKSILLVVIICGVLTGQSVSSTERIDRGYGEPVWVIVNYIKADKRAQFEKFVYDVLLPAFKKNAESDPISRNSLDKTRMLEPREANEDGSYTYIWLMDPVVKKANYSYKSIISRVHNPEETEKYLTMMNECMLSPQVSYRVKQGRW
jgi:hypothetical protein